MATEKVLKDSVENILATQPAMFAVFAEQEGVFNMLYEAEMELLRQKLNDYQNDPRSRSGGGYLLTELNHIYDAKEMLAKHVKNVRDALVLREPKTRKSAKQVEGAVQDKAIMSVAGTLKGLSDKVLRSMAEAVLADHADDYTSSELPYALAYKQITTEYWQVPTITID